MTTQAILCDHAFDAPYAAVHGSDVQHDVPTLLRKLMESLSVNQTELADRLSTATITIGQPQVSRWLRRQDPERANYDRIIELAHEVGVLSDVRSDDVAASLDRPPTRKVKLRGYVGAGARAHFYAISDDELDEVEAPAGVSDRTVAVEIKGKSFGPLMDTWLVYYDDVRSPVTPDLLGRVCVVGLADDRILIKQIKREPDGSYTLLSNSADDPIRDAEIEWAALVTDMKPRR